MIGTRLLAYTHSKQTTCDNYSLIIIQLSMKYLFFALAHDPGSPGKKSHSWQSRTWCQSRNSAKLQAVLPMAAKATPCFSWESAERKWEDPCVAEKTAVSIITPFPGTSTLGVGAARAIWVRLEIFSWRIMVKIEHLGNQHPKSFCRCSFWRIFTGHVLFCFWIFFFALQLISVPQKNTLATQQTFCNYIPASPRVKLGDPAWSSGLEFYRCRCGWNVGARLKQIIHSKPFGSVMFINLPTKGRFVFKAKSVKLVPPQILIRIPLPTEAEQISQLQKGSENQSTRWIKCSKQKPPGKLKKPGP